MTQRDGSVVAGADLLIGIDDTDDLDGRGTGYLGQVLLARLRDLGLGTPVGATRHQLLVDPRIPDTSHNTSACIAWRTGGPRTRRPSSPMPAACWRRRLRRERTRAWRWLPPSG